MSRVQVDGLFTDRNSRGWASFNPALPFQSGAQLRRGSDASETAKSHLLLDESTRLRQRYGYMTLVSPWFSRAVLSAAVLLGGSALAVGQSSDARVFIQFAPGQKAAGRAAVAQARAKEHHVFDDLDAVAVTLPESARAALLRNPAIVLIEEDPTRSFLSAAGGTPQSIPYGIDFVQARAAVTAGATGQGITVGVIDSGVFTQHEDFAGLNITGYPSFGANDERSWNRDRNSHGTHVVGTIAAADNTVGVVGVSPGKVSIYMVKVFGDTGNWVYGSDLLAAARQARTGGAKIISMSLGGARSSSTESRGLSDLYNQGLLLVAAAGNDGTSGTSYPAGYSSVISVAAIDQNKTRAAFSQYNGTVELAAPGVGVTSTVSYLEENSVTVGTTVVQAQHIDFAGRTTALTGALVYGGEGTTPTTSWAGKIVLVDRGVNSFAEKVRNVQAGGGVACIIANNTAGELYATLSAASADASIPALGITQADGAALRALIPSSPATVEALVKSSVTLDQSAYAEFDGTSMATPHVSGVAALVWSAFPQLTNVQLRQVLTSTAKDLGAPGRDNEYGYGLVQAKAAIDSLGGVTTPPQEPPPTTIDSTAPVISNFVARVSNLKTASFEFTWTTNEASTSDVSLNGVAYPDSALVTTHKRTFRGVKGATYNYTVTSRDAAGNVSAPQTNFIKIQ